jgi:hypothetical protein
MVVAGTQTAVVLSRRKLEIWRSSSRQSGPGFPGPPGPPAQSLALPGPFCLALPHTAANPRDDAFSRSTPRTLGAKVVLRLIDIFNFHNFDSMRLNAAQCHAMGPNATQCESMASKSAQPKIQFAGL